MWFVAGAECGRDLQGCVCKLVQALYGLKSSGAAWRAMFSEFVINVMGFKPTRADADVYMRRNLCNGGTPYYEYLLDYVDDVLVISHAPDELMKQIGSKFKIKNGEYGPPISHLGAGISKVQLSSGEECWSLDSRNTSRPRLTLYRDSWPRKDGNSKHQSQNMRDQSP